MKGYMLRRVLLCSVISLSFSQGFEIFAKTDVDPLVALAEEKFNKAIESKTGKTIDRMKCTMTIDEHGDAIESKTKVKYSDYHKKPDFYADKGDMADTAQASEVVEVTYLKKNRLLSVVRTDITTNKLISSQEVAPSSTLNI